MSHYIPSYYRYVSSIAVNTAGTMYTSIPTVSITGGGGTGAAAVAEIRNAGVSSVTITNIGTGYTSQPTVTVSGGGGSGATLTASLSFGQGPSTEYQAQQHLFVKNVLPEFVREDFPQFVTFLDKYYEWMDQVGNPSQLLLNNNVVDIDQATDSTIKQWAAQLAVDVPETVLIDKKTLYKNLKNLYETKGSKQSIQMFFRFLYGEEVTVEYPQEQILVPSDGRWIVDHAIRVSPVNGDYNRMLLDYAGKLIDINYYKSTGSVVQIVRIPATCLRSELIAYTYPPVYELIIDNESGTLDVPGPGAGAIIIPTVSGGAITSLTITNAGAEYSSNPNIIVRGDGTGAVVTVIVTEGKITSASVIDGGSGYTTAELDINTDLIDTFVSLRGADQVSGHDGDVLRTLTSVVTNSYTGANPKFNIGDIIGVNESGDDGRGYATNYFAGDYTLVSGKNNAFIRVEGVDATGLPTSWSIINAGSGFKQNSTVLTVTSKYGIAIQITIHTGYLYNYPGKYLDDRGKLSDVNRLQDNYKYQKYSYVIKSSIQQDKWNKSLKELVHPAGMEVFGDLIIKHEIDFGSFHIVQVDGTIYRVFLTDTLGASANIISLRPGKRFFENLNTNDIALVKNSGVTTYETLVTAEDLAKYLNKSPADIATAADVTAVVVTYNQIFTETQSANDSILIVAEFYRTPSDTVTISDLLRIGRGIVESEIVVTTEDSEWDLNKGIQSVLGALDNNQLSIDFGNGETDSIIITDLPEMAVSKTAPNSNAIVNETGLQLIKQDYAGIYFQQDYVGTVATVI